MSVSFTCPACGATYTTDQVAPGMVFTCGACEELITAPDVPVAAPAARPPARAPRPGLRSPVAHSAARTARGAPSEAGHGRSNMPLVIGLVAVVAVAGVITAIVLGGQGGNGSEAPAGPPAAARGPTVSERIEAILADVPPTSAAGAWAAMQRLSEEADALTATEPMAARAFQARARELRDKVLGFDPDYAELRARMEMVRYGDALLPYVGVDWLTEVERAPAEKLHARISKLAAEDHGWIPAARWTEVEAELARLAPLLEAHRSLAESPFARQARSIGQEIVADLAGRFSSDAKWKGAEIVIDEQVRPFAFIIQTDAGWDPIAVARYRYRELNAVQEIILGDMGKELGLKPIEGPSPVILFRTYDGFKTYSGQEEGIYAWFEPGTNRLVVHDDCTHTTVMHEGTHLLFWAWTSPRQHPLTRSYWFQEGIAEWYSGASRVADEETGEWRYLLGRLHEGRMQTIASTDLDKRFGLKELLSTRKTDEGQIRKDGRTGAAYAQAWFLIYFLNYFNVDERGMVRLNTPGPYREKWMRYVQAELKGETGLEVFLRTMEMEEQDLVRLEQEYWDFYAFIRRKQNLRQVQDGVLIAWDEFTSRTGAKTGEEADDRLIEP